MKKIFVILTILSVFAAAGASAQEAVQPDASVQAPSKKDRGLTSMSNVFVPKGQWITGITASYSAHKNENYSYASLIEGVNSKGHTVKVAPMLGYTFRKNMVAGIRFGYARTYLDVESGGLHMGSEEEGVNIDLDFYYMLKHSYEGVLFWRNYIPFGENKRFALFTEAQLGAGGSQAKFATDNPVKGTYQTGGFFSIAVVPGMVGFVTNDIAFEVSLGVLGITFNHVNQTQNQVNTGKRTSSSMHYNVNLLSINVGMSFYL